MEVEGVGAFGWTRAALGCRKEPWELTSRVEARQRKGAGPVALWGAGRSRDGDLVREGHGGRAWGLGTAALGGATAVHPSQIYGLQRTRWHGSAWSSGAQEEGRRGKGAISGPSLYHVAFRSFLNY